MTTENEIHRAHELGQSFWLDYIRRDLVEDGELARLINANEIRGVTSNPSIFQQAIGGSDLYLAAMRPLAHAGWGAGRIFEVMAIEDIRAATDLLLPLYEGTDGRDGFVSIEVNPEFAGDTQKTLKEARRLWERVDRPNLMVKIPATLEGVPAIEQAIFEGININVTLIFSLERYSEVMEAYIKGLERRTEAGESLDRVASVASFFVSRVDTAVDRKLEAIIREEGPGAERAHALLGRAAIANARLAYAQFRSVFEGSRFERLRELGARLQRPLWASTSTKNPAYSDVLYVDELIGQHTVNTLPPKTLDAFREHGSAKARLEAGLSNARAQLAALAALGISLHEITRDLERDGVRAFADAYASLIETVGERAAGMRRELGPLAPEVERHLKRLDAKRVAPRFWRVDPDLWSETKGGSIVKARIGWLDHEMAAHLNDVKQLAHSLATDKIRRIGWIGGGDPLMAVSEAVDGNRTAASLDTLDPQDLRSFARQTPVASTLFVIESRAPVDPASMAKLAGVWRRARNRLGEAAGGHFVALAPERSQLDEWAGERNIKRMVEWNPSSSAPLSAAGYLQAALVGGDPAELTAGAEKMKALSSPGVEAARNPGLYLGAVLAGASAPLYIAADSAVEARAEWLAKFVRARTKLRVQAGYPQIQGAAIIYLRLDGELESRILERAAEGAPLAILQTEPRLKGVGSEAVRWEVGVAVAAHLSKDATYAQIPQLPASDRLSKMVASFQKRGSFGTQKPNWNADYGSLWWSWRGQGGDEPEDLGNVAAMVLDRLYAGGSLFIGLYRGRSRSALSALSNLRENLAGTRGTLVVFEAGRPPEAMLSNGVTLLIACEPKQDSNVDDLGFTYGELQMASMIADLDQLREIGCEACGIYLRSPEGSSTLLKEMADQVGRRMPDRNPKLEDGVGIGR